MNILRQYIRESVRSARGRHLSQDAKDTQAQKGAELEKQEKSRQLQWDDDPESQAEKEYMEKVQDYLARKEAGLTGRWEKPPSKYKKKGWFRGRRRT